MLSRTFAAILKFSAAIVSCFTASSLLSKYLFLPLGLQWLFFLQIGFLAFFLKLVGNNLLSTLWQGADHTTS